MARSISVKIPTAQLIATIEAKIAEIDKQIAEYPAKREAYEAELEKYKQEVADFVADFLSKNVKRVGYTHEDAIRINHAYGSRIELVFDNDKIVGFPKKPEEPKRPNDSRYYGRDYSTQKDLLEKNLKILKMTSQEEVSASTYGAVMELL